MRKTILFLLIFLIPLAFAKTETTKVLHANDTATVYGKTVTLISASTDGKIKASVDGVQGIIRPGVNRTTNINEMFIEVLNFTYIDSEIFDAILNIAVNFECGDDACNLSEDSIICCTDCGCESNLKCINNLCQKEDCVIEWDCDDNDPCTVDKCSDTSPRTCSNTPVSSCVNDDGCCLESCNDGNDNDCIEKVEEKEEVVEEGEEPQEVEPEIKEIKDFEEPEKVLVTEKEKGILIMAGVALLVIVIGFFIFKKK